MKRTIILITILSLIATNRIKAQQDTLLITLDQAVEIAFNKNATIKIADQEIKRVEYSKKEIIGNLLPNISLGMSYSRALKKQKLFFDVPGMPMSADGIEVGLDNTFNSATNGLSATLPLVAPALWSSINMSNLDMELTMEKARASKIDLLQQVSNAFYSVLMAQDSYQVLKRAFENSTENNRIVQDKFKQGVVSEFESIRADVQLRNVSANLTAAANGVALSKLQLKMLMGIDMQIPINVTGKLNDYEVKKDKNNLGLAELNQLANNSEIKQFDIQTKQLTQTLKMHRAGYLPTLSLAANYNIMSMANDKNLFTESHKWFPTSNVSLVLQIPIFQGGKRFFKEKQIKMQMDELKEQRELMVRGLELQAMSQVNNIEKAMKLIDSNKEAMKQAEKAMAISQKTYDVGAGTYLDVINAELAYMQAGLAYNQSVFEYLTAKTALEKILGQKEIRNY